MVRYGNIFFWLRTAQVMLESFLQAQKVSVRKSLQRSFRKYLTYGEASNQLLMHKLQGLIVEVDKYKLVRIRCSLTVTMAGV
jgi:hypothetical protein